MTQFKTIDTINVSGKRVLVRVDLNVPMKNGKVTDATRIERAAPTVEELADKGAKVVVLSHFGRPDGKRGAGDVAQAAGRAARRGARQAGRLRRGLHRPAGRGGRGGAEAGRDRCCSRISASTRRRRRTTAPSSTSSRRWAISTSTTPSPPRIARTPRPRASPIACRRAAGRLMQAELEALDKALGQPRAAGAARSSAAPRSRPSSTCWAIWSARSTS